MITPFPTIASILSSKALITEILPGFGIRDVAECQFYTGGFNHTYRIRANNGNTYYLRAYRLQWRTPADIQYELDVLNHLKRKGFPAITPLTQEGFQHWIADPQFNPDLWQVAWDGGEIAAGVFNRVDEDANNQFNVQRGWTEPIFTRRPWRRRGLARALLMRSLRMLKDMGMTEAALVVDAQNPLGALGLYESCGFRMEYRSAIYEKGVWGGDVV